jgi:hypothetical protein
MAIPELISDEQFLGLQGSRTQAWRINAEVSGRLYVCDADPMVDLQLRFVRDADTLMWEPKRVLPVMAQFGCTQSGGLGWWGMRFPKEKISAVLAFVDTVTASRSFYRW